MSQRGLQILVSASLRRVRASTSTFQWPSFRLLARTHALPGPTSSEILFHRSLSSVARRVIRLSLLDPVPLGPRSSLFRISTVLRAEKGFPHTLFLVICA